MSGSSLCTMCDICYDQNQYQKKNYSTKRDHLKSQQQNLHNKVLQQKSKNSKKKKGMTLSIKINNAIPINLAETKYLKINPKMRDEETNETIPNKNQNLGSMINKKKQSLNPINPSQIYPKNADNNSKNSKQKISPQQSRLNLQQSSQISNQSQIGKFSRIIHTLNINQAKQKYKQCLKTTEQDDQIAYLHSLMMYASILNKQPIKDIQQLYSKAIQIYQPLQDKYFEEIIVIKHQLAQFYSNTQNLKQKGLSIFSEVRKLQQKYFSKDSDRNFLTRNNRACTLCDLKQYEEGIKQFKQSIAECKKLNNSKSLNKLLQDNLNYYQTKYKQQVKQKSINKYK